ncbi:MAG: hypothetical protein WAU84_25540, partial [Thermoguttaceae bacterium]
AKSGNRACRVPAACRIRSAGNGRSSVNCMTGGDSRRQGVAFALESTAEARLLLFLSLAGCSAL